MNTKESVLPDSVRSLPVEKQLKRLLAMNPAKGKAIAFLVTDALEREFQKEFHAGARGGLRVKSKKGGE